MAGRERLVGLLADSARLQHELDRVLGELETYTQELQGEVANAHGHATDALGGTKNGEPFG